MNNKDFPHHLELLYLHRKSATFNFELGAVEEINEERKKGCHFSPTLLLYIQTVGYDNGEMVYGNTGAILAFYSVDAGVLLWKQRLRGVKLPTDTSASSVEVKKGRKYVSAFPICSHGVDKDNSTSLLLKQMSWHLKRVTTLQEKSIMAKK
jgi:hypothetical protein